MAKRRGNHEGTIFKRSNGSWRAQVTINGRRVSKTFSTQKECRNWIRNIQRQIHDGLTFNATQITVERFLDDWLTSTKSSLRENTWKQYKQIVRDHIVPALGRVKLQELRPDQIQNVYNEKVAAGKGLRTIQLTHSVLHRALNQAVKLGMLGRNPDDATNPPKPKQREMSILDEGQIQTLLITAQSIQFRYSTLYHLAINTGMRQSELLGLKWADLDWEQHTISVNRQLLKNPGGGNFFGPPKTKSGVRVIRVGKVTVTKLREHLKHQLVESDKAGMRWQENDLIFPSTIGTPMQHRSLLRKFKKVLNRSNLPDIRFHDLRHSAAALMLNHGTPVIIVSKRLGHSKPSITLDIYGHLIPSMQGEVAELMDELITPVQLEIAPELHQK